MMTTENSESEWVLFSGTHLVGRGRAPDMARLAKHRQDTGEEPVFVYVDQSGLRLDLDLSGTQTEVLARLDEHPALGRARSWTSETRRRLERSLVVAQTLGVARSPTGRRVGGHAPTSRCSAKR